MKPISVRGVLPAVNVPLAGSYAIDYATFSRHIKWLCTFDIGGIVVNGHAGEVEALSSGERRDVVNVARESAGDDILIVSGVVGSSPVEVASMANDVEQAGANALLVFPLPQFAFGGRDRADLVIPYFELLVKETSLPLVVFRYGADTGLMYSVEVLVELVKKVSQIVGIKDASLDYERLWVTCRNLDRNVQLLVAQGHLFLSRFTTADGAISSLANVIPQEVTALYREVSTGSKEAATKISRAIWALCEAIYTDVPLMQHWVVEKEVLRVMGRFPTSVARPPFQPLSDREKLRVERAVGMLKARDLA